MSLVSQPTSSTGLLNVFTIGLTYSLPAAPCSAPSLIGVFLIFGTQANPLLLLMENAAEHGNCKLISISLREDKGGYAVIASDDGSGIQPSLQESLFDVRKRCGGVSLHVAKEVVDRCGGTIEVRNRIRGSPKKGAEFRIWLPKMVG